MKCRRSEELWSDYLERTLPQPLRMDLEEHLDSCSPCASLLTSFREVLETLGSLPHPQPAPDLVERILIATRSRVAAQPKPLALGLPSFALPSWGNWAVGAAAAVCLVVLFLRPPAALSALGNRASRFGHQAYSFGLRAYRGSERLIDELNVLRMTVGVAFEDRLDRLNERLKDLEEARRKREGQPEKSSDLTPPLRLTHMEANPKSTDLRSLL